MFGESPGKVRKKSGRNRLVTGFSMRGRSFLEAAPPPFYATGVRQTDGARFRMSRKSPIFAFMKNIVFDLGGVVFARNIKRCTQEFIDFFSFVRSERMPRFWEEYDRGTSTFEEVTRTLADMNGCSLEKCASYLRYSIELQEPVQPTEALIRQLKQAGYRLYILSNMSREFIAYLRTFPVYGLFEGEVVSCEEGGVKPEPRIYELLLQRFGLDPAETLFIDDRGINLEAAAAFGIHTQRFDPKAPEATCRLLREQLLG